MTVRMVSYHADMGASSSPVNGRKIQHIKEVANSRGLPIVLLGESTGARMPDVMGAEIAQAWGPTQYLRRRETQWISAVLGHCYGSASRYSAMADFVVMRKGAIMAVSSPKLASMATSEATDPEELEGPRTNLAFFRELLQDGSFVSGNYDTRVVERLRPV